jgi:hypothetical protein
VSDVLSLQRIIRQEQRLLDQRRGEARAVAEQGRRAQQEARELTEQTERLTEAVEILNRFADARQEEVRRRLEGLVTYGLRAIFDEDLALHVRSKTVGRRQETEFTLTSTHDGHEIETSILDSRGGGVAAVSGFLLKLILLILRGDQLLMLEDESFAQVSAEYEPRLAEFLSELADRMAVRIVLVTHSTAFEDVSDAVYRTSSQDGLTKLTRVR